MKATRVVVSDDPAEVRDGTTHTPKDLPNLVVVAEAEVGPSLFATLAQPQPDCLLLDVANVRWCLHRHVAGK